MKLSPNVLNILLVVVPTLGELWRRAGALGWDWLRWINFPKEAGHKVKWGSLEHVWVFWTSWSGLLETLRSCRFILILAVTSAVPDSPPHIVPLQCSWGCLTLGQQPVTSSGWFGTQDFPLMLPDPCHGPSDALFPPWLINQVLLNRNQGKVCVGIAAPA